MEAASWTAIAVMAGFSFATFFYLGSKIDGLATRMDARFDRMDERFDALDARLTARIDLLTDRVEPPAKPPRRRLRTS